MLRSSDSKIEVQVINSGFKLTKNLGKGTLNLSDCLPGLQTSKVEKVVVLTNEDTGFKKEKPNEPSIVKLSLQLEGYVALETKPSGRSTDAVVTPSLNVAAVPNAISEPNSEPNSAPTSADNPGKRAPNTATVTTDKKEPVLPGPLASPKPLILEIRDMKCDNLINTGSILDKQDPSLVFEYESSAGKFQKHRTARQKDAGCSAKFSETFIFDLTDSIYSDQFFSIKVKAINEGSAQNTKFQLGDADIRITDLPTVGSSKTVTVTLVVKDTKQAPNQGKPSTVTMTLLLSRLPQPAIGATLPKSMVLQIDNMTCEDLKANNNLLDKQDPKLILTFKGKTKQTFGHKDGGTSANFEGEQWLVELTDGDISSPLQVQVVNENLTGLSFTTLGTGEKTLAQMISEDALSVGAAKIVSIPLSLKSGNSDVVKGVVKLRMLLLEKSTETLPQAAPSLRPVVSVNKQEPSTPVEVVVTGLLKFRQIDCFELASVSKLSKNDNFVTLECGSWKQETAVQNKSGDSATWNSPPFSIAVSDSTFYKNKLKLKVFDHNDYRNNELIGEGTHNHILKVKCY